MIYEREGRRFIRDLRPHSDTLVNDQPVKEAELQPGDRIRIGESNLVYQIVAPVEENATPLPLFEDLDGENGDGNGYEDAPIPVDDLPQDDPLPASGEESSAAVDEIDPSEPVETNTDAPLALAESNDEDVIPFPLESRTLTSVTRRSRQPPLPKRWSFIPRSRSSLGSRNWILSRLHRRRRSSPNCLASWWKLCPKFSRPGKRSEMDPMTRPIAVASPSRTRHTIKLIPHSGSF